MWISSSNYMYVLSELVSRIGSQIYIEEKILKNNFYWY